MKKILVAALFGLLVPLVALAQHTWAPSTWIPTEQPSAVPPGTVQSVGITFGPTFWTCANNPITTSGTFDCQHQTVTANFGLWGPASGSPAQPSYRASLPADLGASSATNKFLADAGGVNTWVQPALLSAYFSDVVAHAPVRGYLLYGNSTPAWAGLTVGSASTLLKSDGTDVSWGTVNLLSAFHADTAANAATRGGVIVGNSTPAWARVTVGAQYTALVSDGTDTTFTMIPHKVCYSITPVTDTSLGTESIILQCAIPQGTLGANGVIRIMASGQYKSNVTASTATLKIHLGAAGTTSDTTVYNSTVTEPTSSATFMGAGWYIDLYAINSTSSQQCFLNFTLSSKVGLTTGTGGLASAGGNEYSAVQCAVSALDMAAGGTMYLSLTWTHSGSTSSQVMTVTSFQGYYFP